MSLTYAEILNFDSIIRDWLEIANELFGAQGCLGITSPMIRPYVEGGAMKNIVSLLDVMRTIRDDLPEDKRKNFENRCLWDTCVQYETQNFVLKELCDSFENIQDDKNRKDSTAVKKVCCIGALILIGVYRLLATTATVDGITWTYTVSSGEASLGGGSSSSRAVPSSTTGSLTIPSRLGGYPVTGVGAYAFSGCSGLTSVTIPNSVTNIGASAFFGCSGLASVTIPNSVTNIGASAFSGCSGLEDMTLPFVGACRGNTGSGDSLFGHIFGSSFYRGGTRIEQYYYSSSPSSVYCIPSKLRKVEITDETVLGYGAFYNCSGLTSVAIPNRVTNIGSDAFYNCTNLTSVYITDLAKWCDISFDNYYANPLIYAKKLFLNGSLVENLTIPDSVTNIGDYAFSGCSGLTSVSIGNGVTNIGDCAFYGCSGLTSVTIPDSVTSIGNSAFSGCRGLMSIVIPRSVEVIGYNAFKGCTMLENVKILNSEAKICNDAFEYCGKVRQVTLPSCSLEYCFPNSYASITNVVICDGVTSIGEKSFQKCSELVSITIPKSVTSVGYYAFSNCYKLSKICVEDLASWCNIEGLYYLQEGTSINDRIWVHGKPLIGDLRIPDGVRRIPRYAFSGCSKLTSVVVPNSVTNIGFAAFQGCGELTTMTLPFVGSSRDHHSGSGAVLGHLFGYDSYSGGVYTWQRYSDDGDNGYRYYIPASLRSVTITDAIVVGYGAFYGCSGITNVTIRNSVDSIGPYAFYLCSGLTKVTIPDTVTNIAKYAFCGCGALTSITIPDSVTNIGSSAFRGCSGLTSVTIPNSVTSIWDSTFSGCSGLASVTIPNSVTSIGDSAFSGCSGLTSVTISGCVTEIGESAFNNCSGLTKVTIPDSVTRIGHAAFSGCSGLEEITLPFVGPCRGGTGLPDYVFGYIFGGSPYDGGSEICQQYDVSSWSTVKLYIPTSLKTVVLTDEGTIGCGAFSGCSGLMSVTIPNSVTEIGDYAFSGCYGLTSQIIPNSVLNIGANVFYGCNDIMSVVIPQSVCDCGLSSVFPDSYKGIRDVVVQNGVTNISSVAFAGCEGLSTLMLPPTLESIEASSFYDCTALTRVDISDGFAWCDIAFGDRYSNPLCHAHDLFVNGAPVNDISQRTTISDYAFAGCTNLQAEVWGGYRVLDGWLIGYTDEAEETIPDADKLKGICSEALKGCTALRRLEFGDDSRLVLIGAEALKGCTELKTLVLPPSLTRIGDEACMGCSYLDNVIVPGSVKSIGNCAFKNCTGFTWAQIEHGVESIGEEAFYGCWMITEVDIPSSVSSIGVNAFGGDSLITKVALRGDIRKMSEIFSTYDQINEATIKPGTGAIVDGLFGGCWSLDNVAFLGNCPALANDGRNIYSNTSYVVTYVDKDSTGWDGTPGSHALPMKWPLVGNYRREITYAEEIVAPSVVSFDANGGYPNMQNLDQYSEENMYFPDEPTKADNLFDGWYTQKVGGMHVTTDTVFVHGVYNTLYAHWKPVMCNVTLNANGGTVEDVETGDGKSSVKVAVAKNNAVGALPTPKRTGYAFAGWYTKKSGGTKISAKTKITKNVTYYARWTVKKYSVSVAKSGKGTVKGTGSKAYKSKVTLTATASKGYVFVGWHREQVTGNGEQGTEEVLVNRNAKYTFTMPAEAVKLKARFITTAADKAAIGLSVGGVGVGAMDGGSGQSVLPALTNTCGIVMDPVSVVSEGVTPTSVTVTGLPAGLKYDANKGRITGVPTTAKTYTVKFTVKSRGASRAWTQKWTIKALPKFARGTFNGWTRRVEDNAPYLRKVTVSVTTAGKITAKVGSLSFSGTGWSRRVVDNAPYRETYVANLRAVRTVGTGKSAKKYTDVMTLTLDPAAEWTEDQLTGCVATFNGTVSLADAVASLEGEGALVPSNADIDVSARRNPFGDNADAKTIAADLVALGTQKIVDGDGGSWNVKVATSGVATITRTTGSGKNKKTISATAVVELANDGDGYSASARFLVSGKVVEIDWQ